MENAVSHPIRYFWAGTLKSERPENDLIQEFAREDKPEGQPSTQKEDAMIARELQMQHEEYAFTAKSLVLVIF
jgi:hypothetical protein